MMLFARVSIPQLLLYTALLACIVGLLRLVAWWSLERVPRAHRPHKLFQTLCSAHGLDHSQQRLLTLISKSLALPHPCEIFIRSELLDCQRLGPQFQPYAAQLSQLKELLFAGDASKPSTAG